MAWIRIHVVSFDVINKFQKKYATPKKQSDWLKLAELLYQPILDIQVREILSIHDRSMSPASFKVMDRTLSPDLDEIINFNDRSQSPGFVKDPRYSAGYEDKITYQVNHEQGMS